MNAGRPARLADPEAAVDAVVDALDGRIRLAMPLGLGKPALFVNALYRRARAHPEISLDIYTALTLETPRPSSGLEARFLGPLVERLYAAVPDLEYAADLHAGRVPANVRIHEFYFRPGAFLGVPAAQRGYISSNYTHVARDVAARGINLLAQMVAPASGADHGRRYSLSCNPDITGDLLDALRAAGQPAPLLLGEVNPTLPFLYGDAEMDATDFAVLLEGEDIAYDLFPVPKRPVSLPEQVIGARVAALVGDGGTLQIGIGSLGDAVCGALCQRRRDNARFRAVVAALGMTERAQQDDLPEGLYALSEMFVEGFLHLRDHGVLRRTVDDGVFLHGGFFLGSASFYRRLRDLDDAERRGIRMSRISFTNNLLGGEAEKRDQRRGARFVNTAMMMSLLGAAVSDALEDGRVVSGVGGQYNFVAQAHELSGGRSVLVVPATRTSKGKVTSNIVWRYGHTTIPRHLRDLVVTEYGVADLRGKTDQDVIVAMLNLADSRFQEPLRRQAVEAGKLAADYRIPARFRRNTPERLRRDLADAGVLDGLPWYPLDTDLSTAEAQLAIGLAALAEQRGSRRGLARLAWQGWRQRRHPALRDALARMDLERPRGLRERLYQALVAGALVRELLCSPQGGAVTDGPDRPLFDPTLSLSWAAGAADDRTQSDPQADPRPPRG
ncbi:MAG: acetyl-CoA hydrolase [Gammaproteobacteria bacterium]|jgi:acyl-CoA hydrolase|nr:acetyl-CoA hydrolase [Gammaproteobacteria bacterium]